MGCNFNLQELVAPLILSITYDVSWLWLLGPSLVPLLTGVLAFVVGGLVGA